MTNHERIQNMSVDEMAEFIERIMSCVQGCARIPDCKLCTISDFCRRGYFINEWLVKEADEKND